MDTLLKADIFFFVTAVAVVLLTALFTVAIVYAIKILKDARYVAGVARAEADRIAEDIAAVRSRIREESFKGLGAWSALSALWKKKQSKKGRRSRDI